jgi:hypothetical protein
VAPSPVSSALLAAAFAALLAALVACALALGARPAHADDAPILLTNEDVARLRGAKADEPKAQKPAERDAAPPVDSTTASIASRERVADSWQEEYYRLKALALQRALARGEPIEPDEPFVGAYEAVPAEVAGPEAGEPSCFYGSRGQLIHAPEGVTCRQNRRIETSARGEMPGSKDMASCLYGLHGEVLHTPPGKICPRRRR